MKNSDEKGKTMSGNEFEQTQLTEHVKNASCVDISRPKDLVREISIEDGTLMKFERSKSLDPTQYVDFERMKHRMPSIMSLGGWDGVAALGESCESIKNKKWYSSLSAYLETSCNEIEMT